MRLRLPSEAAGAPLRFVPARIAAAVIATFMPIALLLLISWNRYPPSPPDTPPHLHLRDGQAALIHHHRNTQDGQGGGHLDLDLDLDLLPQTRDDLEMHWARRALNTPKDESPGRRKRIALLFLVKSCMPLEQVWERWLLTSDDPHRYTIYVHQDGVDFDRYGLPYTVFDSWRKDLRRRVNFVPHIPSARFSWNLVFAMLLMVREVWHITGNNYRSNMLFQLQAIKDEENECFVLLSDTTLPISTPQTLENRILPHRSCKSTLQHHSSEGPHELDLQVMSQWQILSRTDAILILKYAKVSFQKIASQISQYHASNKGYHSYDEWYLPSAFHYVYHNGSLEDVRAINNTVRIEQQTHVFWRLEDVKDTKLGPYFLEERDMKGGHPLSIRAEVFREKPMSVIREALYPIYRAPEAVVDKNHPDFGFLFLRKVFVTYGAEEVSCKNKTHVASKAVGLFDLDWTA